MSFIDTILENESLKIFILSMLPITELRFSIPYGILFYKLPMQSVIFLSIIGNIIIGIIVIYIIGPIMNILKKIEIFNSVIEYIFTRTKNKGKIIDNMKFYGLVIFVGIPFPLTGVWTGSLAAYLFDLSKKKSILAIIFGVLISSTIVTLLTIYGKIIL